MQVIFVGTNGVSRTVEATLGSNLMRAAVDADVAGIQADCGGMLTCGTCHVYVHESCAERLPQPTHEEREMLEFVAAERRPTSRLACQIELTQDMDGLTVTVPDKQY